ncbi:LysM peptidoglycan-binding domain-containing protein [Microcystis flos-aquae FACHB-1344]|uniref:LysM peptidoglycan-binding domain-containing protein n=1 Tax=Microcystis flos-aquae FACHB-1344 TaxID=2692899 RepID=A0ABR8I161_9CHRO|nr:LysM peptidoglycan-binding domain-containing protein [Microcystis flos-aquae]MBD2624731.1 LysM peptidoglycan-binding domain-containing protein [Microcystis flos-aquae FACHB-1344]
MVLETPTKLKIKPLPPSKLPEITVQFNPTAYSITKPVTWSPQSSTGTSASTASTTQSATQINLNAPVLQFGGGGSRTLVLELFFDVTEPVEGKPVDDVRQLTNKIVKLTRIERDTNQPPICTVSWGNPLDPPEFPFIGVVTNLVQNFTLFKSDGKPLRARLTVTFTEWIDRKKDLIQTDPEQTTRLVKRGDTLSSLAAEVYGDPNLWRIIAQANNLDDPRHLKVSNPLIIPKLR